MSGNLQVLCNSGCAIYEVVSAVGVNLRTSPNTANLGNLIMILFPGLLIERVDDCVYPDSAGSGDVFFKVQISQTPNITGYAAAQGPSTTISGGTSYYILQTISAISAHKTLFGQSYFKK